MSEGMTRLLLSSLAVHPSEIHGNGVFATEKCVPGQIIFVTTKFTVLPKAAHGTVERSEEEHVFEPRVLRWVNHSCCHNSLILFVGGEVRLVCVAELRPEEEVVCDYRLTEGSIPTPFRCNCGHCGGILIR